MQPVAALKIAILADVPVTKLPDLGLNGAPIGHYATWLEALVPEFGQIPDIEVHWVTMWKGTNKPLHIKAYGQDFHIMPRGKKMISMLTGYLAESAAISRTITTIKPDFVHAWGSEDVYGLAGSRLRSVPKLFSLQGCLNECLARSHRSSWLFRLQAAYERPTIKAYPYGTGESPTSVAHLRRMNPQMTVRQVDYGVAKDFFETTWQPSTTPNLVFAGSVSKAKGVHDLISVFKRPELSHVTLHVAGDGELATVLGSESATNVRWHGRISREELISLMSCAWGLVIPTYADTGPSVVKEARVMGLPVITTSCAGASSYIVESKAGCVIAPGDRSALLDSVLKFCSSRENTVELGRRQWEAARRYFHPSTTAAAFADLYRSLLKT